MSSSGAIKEGRNFRCQMGNLCPIVSFFVNINLLFFLSCCCFSSTRSANFNADDATFIKGYDVSSSDSVRHYGVPHIDEFPCGRGPAELPRWDKVGSKIVGGSEAVKNSWPFMVALKVNNVMRCGGSLISPNKILTAAHCVEKESFFGFSQMTVSLGMHTVEKNDAQVTRRVIRVKIHNEYAFLAYTNVTTTNVNDIAILTLDDPVSYSTAISPVCLPPANANPDQYAGRDSAAIGWGRLQEGGSSSNVLRETTLRITTYAECKAVYPSLLTSMLCTYSSGKDTCQGDSGSPIIIKSPSGVWTQVAIVSFGLGCARPAIPGVNTRVTAFKMIVIAPTNLFFRPNNDKLKLTKKGAREPKFRQRILSYKYLALTNCATGDGVIQKANNLICIIPPLDMKVGSRDDAQRTKGKLTFLNSRRTDKGSFFVQYRVSPKVVFGNGRGASR